MKKYIFHKNRAGAISKCSKECKKEKVLIDVTYDVN